MAVRANSCKCAECSSPDAYVACSLRTHLRTTGAHARYVGGYDLEGLTLAGLTELHDDMPVTVAECRRFPGRYGR